MDGMGGSSAIESMKPYLVVRAREVPLPAGLHTDGRLFVLDGGVLGRIQCFWGTCLSP